MSSCSKLFKNKESTIIAFPENEIPKVTVTPDTQILKHDEDLNLFCNLTNKGSDGNKLEKMYWFKDDVLLDSLKIEESEKDSLEFPREIKRVGVRNGGIYSCVLEAKLRGVLGHNVSDDAMIRSKCFSNFTSSITEVTLL